MGLLSRPLFPVPLAEQPPASPSETVAYVVSGLRYQREALLSFLNETDHKVQAIEEELAELQALRNTATQLLANLDTTLFGQPEPAPDLT